MVKDYLETLKDKIYDRLQNGFSTEDIPEIVDMIKDIEVLDRFVTCECDEYSMGDSRGKDDVKWLLRNIEDELKAAEKYSKKWADSKDASYKTMGRDELRHAEILIKSASAKSTMQEQKEELQGLTAKYQALLKTLS